MKKHIFTYLTILALILVFVFTSCSGDPGDPLPVAGDGWWGSSITFNAQVYRYSDGLPYLGPELTVDTFYDYSDNFTELSSIGLDALSISTTGKLSGTWGAPSSEGLTDNNAVSLFIHAGFNISDTNAKIFVLGIIPIVDGGSKIAELSMENSFQYVMYLFTDRDVKIQGVGEGYANMDLKAGWNTVIVDNNAYTIVSGKPSSSLPWVIRLGSGGSGDPLPPAGDGWWGVSRTFDEQVYRRSDGLSYSGVPLTVDSFYDDHDVVKLSSIGLDSLSISADGILSGTWGTPSSAGLADHNAISEFTGLGLNVSDTSAKMLLFGIIPIFASEIMVNELSMESLTQQATTVYTDNDVTITGTVMDFAFNIELKTGWNTVISDGEAKTFVSGKPSSTLPWTLHDS